MERKGRKVRTREQGDKRKGRKGKGKERNGK